MDFRKEARGTEAIAARCAPKSAPGARPTRTRAYGLGTCRIP